MVSEGRFVIMLMVEYKTPTRAAERESRVRNPVSFIARLVSPSCFLSALPSLLVQALDAEG